MRSLIHALLVIFCSLSFSVGSAETDNRDSIVKSDGREIRAFIIDEKIGEMVYSAKLSDASLQTVRWKDVKSFSYYAQEGSLWQGPIEALANGDYETAMKQFSGIGGISKVSEVWTLKEEWETILTWKRAYGLFYLGVTLETMNNRAEAATVFGILAEKMPEHRLSMYAIFRQAINLALSGGDPKPAIEAMKKFTTTDAAALAGDLEKAMSVVALSVTDFTKAARESGRLRSRFREDVADWIYWRELWSSILLEQGDVEGALNFYDEMLGKLGSLPKYSGHITLLKARALKSSGKPDDALFLYLKADVLPFLGQSELAESRLEAAKIYLERLKGMEDGDEKTRIADLCKGLLNGVVTNGPKFNDIPVTAQLLLSEHFPAGEGEEEEEADEEEADPEEEAE